MRNTGEGGISISVGFQGFLITKKLGTTLQNYLVEHFIRVEVRIQGVTCQVLENGSRPDQIQFLQKTRVNLLRPCNKTTFHVKKESGLSMNSLHHCVSIS